MTLILLLQKVKTKKGTKMVSEFQVTEIVPLDKKRSKIFLDNEFAFVLYKGELHSLKLSEGILISQEMKDHIEKDILTKRAKLRAMNLLKSRSYTEAKLSEKLRQGLYPEKIVQEAIAYVKSYHYVDDYQYAKDYVAYHFEDKPEQRIILDLQRKGVSKDVIYNALLEIKEEMPKDAEEKMIAIQVEKYLSKRNVAIEELCVEEKQKLCASLVRKGFSYDSVRCILSVCE